MDQYLVQFEFSMMYFDMIELIQLINESENEQLLDYADDLQIIIDEQTKTTKTSKNNDKLIIGDVSNCSCGKKVECANCGDMVIMTSDGEFCPHCYC